MTYTEEELRQIADYVKGLLRNDSTNVAAAGIVEDVGEIANILGYDKDNHIKRISPATLNKQESENKGVIEELSGKLNEEIKRATEEEDKLSIFIAGSIANVKETIDNITFVGEGNTYLETRFFTFPNHTYRLYVSNPQWKRNEITLTSTSYTIFAVEKKLPSAEKWAPVNNIQVTPDNDSVDKIKSYYDFVAEEGYIYRIGFRANEGEEVKFVIHDMTNENAIKADINNNKNAIAAEVQRAAAKEEELLNLLQGESESVSPISMPFKLISVTSISKIKQYFDDAITNNGGIIDPSLFTNHAGTYRTVVGGVVYDIKFDTDILNGVAVLTVKGLLSVEDGNILKANSYSIAECSYSNNMWSDWKLVASSDIVKQTNSNSEAITAEEQRAKKAEQSIYEQAIEQGKALALRSLFATIGALYNDTDEDIERIAPWSTEEVYTPNADGTYTYSLVDAVVKHKPKCYYMNGIGDITEEQMTRIYSEREAGYQLDSNRRLQDRPLRTIYLINRWAGQTYANYPIKGTAVFGSPIEVFYLAGLANKYVDVVRSLEISNDTFRNCTKLSILSGLRITNSAAATQAFDNCRALREVFISGLKQSINLSASANITRRSVLHLINNSAATSAITIQLHSDVYARLENDAEVLTALSNKPLVTITQ